MIPKIYSLSTLVLLAVLVSLLVGTQGAAKSVIIDNTDAKIIYSPDGWATEGTCPSCFPQLDKSRVHGGTWRFSNNTPNAGFTFFFTGISVELRYIASDTVQMLAERVSYALDGVQGQAAQTQRLDPISFAYDQSLFKLNGLTNTAHTLQVNIAPASSVMFDYLIYEEPDPVVTTPANITPVPSTNPGPTTNKANPNPTANANANTNANPTPTSSSVGVNSAQTTNANSNSNTSPSPTSAGTNTKSSSTTANDGSNSNPIVINGVNSSPSNNSTLNSSATPLTLPNISGDSGKNPTTPVGAIVGGVLGGLALLFLALFLLYLRKRRGGGWQPKTPWQNENQAPAPFFADSTPLDATTPALREFKNYRSWNTVVNEMQESALDQPVEAGLMSRSRFSSFPSSDSSRRTPAST